MSKRSSLVGECPNHVFKLPEEYNKEFLQWISMQPINVVLQVPYTQSGSIHFLTNPMGGWGGSINPPFRARKMVADQLPADNNLKSDKILIEEFLYRLEHSIPLDEQYAGLVAHQLARHNVAADSVPDAARVVAADSVPDAARVVAADSVPDAERVGYRDPRGGHLQPDKYVETTRPFLEFVHNTLQRILTDTDRKSHGMILAALYEHCKDPSDTLSAGIVANLKEHYPLAGEDGQIHDTMRSAICALTEHGNLKSVDDILLFAKENYTGGTSWVQRISPLPVREIAGEAVDPQLAAVMTSRVPEVKWFGELLEATSGLMNVPKFKDGIQPLHDQVVAVVKSEDSTLRAEAVNGVIEKLGALVCNKEDRGIAAFSRLTDSSPEVGFTMLSWPKIEAAAEAVNGLDAQAFLRAVDTVTSTKGRPPESDLPGS